MLFRSKVAIKEIYFTYHHDEYVEDLDIKEKYIVTPKIIESVSDVKTPQGVVFVCEIPKEMPFEDGPVLALDDVRDSGNLGTLIRTAEGFGIKNIALLGNCAEVYNPKTVRATMGSVFRITPVKIDFDNLKD